MQTTLESEAHRISDPRMENLAFIQHNPDGTVSTYNCSWLREEGPTEASRAASRYLQTCFNDPTQVNQFFTPDKLRCHRLARQVRTAPFIARRFVRSAPTMLHVNRHTRKHVVSGGVPDRIVDVLCRERLGYGHDDIQRELMLNGGFVALEVPLYSPQLTGHLDCLICPQEIDTLFALEVKSYPSDFTDPWAGTGKWRLYKNLVQALGYAELLAHNTGLTQIATGIIHTDGVFIFDAADWLRQERTLLAGIRSYLSRTA